MIKYFIRKSWRSGWAISIYFIVIVFAVTRLALVVPNYTEDIYTLAIYPAIAKLMASLSNLFLFSVDDVFYALLISLLVINSLLLIFRRLSFRHFLARVLYIVAVVYCCFNLLWGFNYYREDINERLKMGTAKADTNELMKAFSNLIEKTNDTYTPIYSLDKSEVLKKIQNSYSSHAVFLNIDIGLLKTTPKSISLSQLFGAATISGYYGPFFSEVHLNDYILPLEYPQVLAHEMAHKLGVTRESEANFYAWLVCSKSNDKQLAYSANLYLMQYFVYECYKYEGFSDVVKNIRYEVRHDFYKSHYHWMALMDKNVELVATKVNDVYLKSNNVEAGIEDYEGVVKHVMDYLLLEHESQ